MALALLLILAAPSAADRAKSGFAEFMDEARARGYSNALLDQTLAGLTLRPGMIVSDRRQAERTQSLEEYEGPGVT